jgi:hypothetical protein
MVYFVFASEDFADSAMLYQARSYTRTSISTPHPPSPPSSSLPVLLCCTSPSCSVATAPSQRPSRTSRTMPTHGSHQYSLSLNITPNTSHSGDKAGNTVYTHIKTPDSHKSFAPASSSASPSLSFYQRSSASSNPPSPCLDCVVDCNDATCIVSPTSMSPSGTLPTIPCSDASCKDQYIIIPCNDSSHVAEGGNTCFDNSCFESVGECFDSHCADEPCSLEDCFSKLGDVCAGGENCTIDHLVSS